MKSLNRKVFLAIFTIISLFFLIVLIGYNIQTYKKQYEDVYRNLTFVEEMNKTRPEPRRFNENITRPDNIGLDNLMIVDYEVYTVKLNNNEITKIIAHNDYESDFDVVSIAEKIINKDKKVKIGNLYHSKYAYNHKIEDTIVIMNTESVSKRLRITLFSSILFMIGVEILIYLFARIMTRWITKPAIESFDKQKDFIADASHELKTPLAVIMASSDELRSDKKNAKYVENIKYETDRMNKLITGLLDLYK